MKTSTIRSLVVSIPRPVDSVPSPGVSRKIYYLAPIWLVSLPGLVAGLQLTLLNPFVLKHLQYLVPLDLIPSSVVFNT